MTSEVTANQASLSEAPGSQHLWRRLLGLAVLGWTSTDEVFWKENYRIWMRAVVEFNGEPVNSVKTAFKSAVRIAGLSHAATVATTATNQRRSGFGFFMG